MGTENMEILKVVIADDEVRICQLIQALIDWDSMGMKVVGIAHNGEEACEMVRQTQPDILITDIRMPGCSGLELVKKGEGAGFRSGSNHNQRLRPFRVCTAGYQLRCGTLSSEAGKQGGTDCYPAEIAEKDRGAQGVGTESSGACK